MRQKRRRARIELVAVILAGIAAAFFGLAYASHARALSITDVQAQGNAVTDSAELQAYAREQIAGSYLGFFSRANSFLYPRRQIERGLLDGWKRLSGASVSLSGLHTLVISVTERKPSALWCGSMPPAASAPAATSQDCYFLDQDGYVYDHAPDFSGGVFVEYYGGLQNPESPIGQSFLSPDGFRQVGSFIDGASRVRGLALTPTELFQTADGDFELRFSNGIRVFFNSDQPFADQLQNLGAFLSNQSLGLKLADKSFGIDYVDLRFGSKIFYKPRGAAAQGAASSTVPKI